MPTTLPALAPATVTVPPDATYDVTRDDDGTPVAILYTHDGQPAVQLRAADVEGAIALHQSARALATSMGVMVP